ncbi:hypothetical protein [Melittangium boletus]|nr:hypothetical protein [Melittangium boletus]
MNRGSRRALARATVLGLGLLGATSAWATGTFPNVVRSELALSSFPSCTLCHQGNPAVGTVVTPFGTSMRAKGLIFYDEASLKKALATLDAEKVDSDADGVPDIEELKTGRDPNRAEATSGDGTPIIDDVLPEPTYGCGAAPGGLSMGLAGLLLLLKRRR